MTAPATAAAYRLATTLLDHRALPRAGADRRCTTSAGSTRSPTSRCATPCCRAGSCAPATPPGSSRRCGRCWPLYQALRDRRHRRRPDRPRHRPRPRQLPDRRPDRPEPRHHRPQHHRPPPTTWPATSAAPSWRACTAPAGPASAPARSSPRSAAGTSTRPANPAPACRSPTSPPTIHADHQPQRHAARNHVTTASGP